MCVCVCASQTDRDATACAMATALSLWAHSQSLCLREGRERRVRERKGSDSCEQGGMSARGRERIWRERKGREFVLRRGKEQGVLRASGRQD